MQDTQVVLSSSVTWGLGISVIRSDVSGVVLVIHPIPKTQTCIHLIVLVVHSLHYTGIIMYNLAKFRIIPVRDSSMMYREDV